MSELDKIIIYTDGGCSPNPGKGGWACILIDTVRDKRKELSGYESDTTNNKMELKAVIQALSALKYKCEVILYTDSIYVKNGINQWIHSWKMKNWKTSTGKPVKNKELWEELDSLRDKHVIEFEWVRGHSGDENNERCDELVKEAMNLAP